MHEKKLRLFDAFVVCGIKRLEFPKQDVITGLELIIGAVKISSATGPKKDEKDSSSTKYVDISGGCEELWLKIRMNEMNKIPIAHIDLYEADFEEQTGITVNF